MIKKLTFNWQFCLLVLLVIGINIPFFRPDFFPAGDSRDPFCAFYFFYNEFFFHHHLARWMPYSTYGVPTVLNQLDGLTPMSYLVGFIGFLAKVKDTLWLWKISIVLDQIVFLLGLYWLVKLLYIRKSVIFFICSIGVMSTFWWYQIFFNFRLFYLVPVCAYFIILFFKEKRIEFLWLSGIIGISMFLGNIQYFAAIWLFFIFIFIAVLLIWHRDVYKYLFTLRVSALGMMSAFLMLAVVYGYFAFGYKHGIGISVVGRDPLTGMCSLEHFLTYNGGGVTLSMLLKGFIVGDMNALLWGSTVYLGILPLVFFIWSIFRVRNIYYYAFLMIVIALIAFSFGGIFTKIVYYFPLMSWYRNIGLVYGLIKVPVLICAGFGFENFLNSLSKDGFWRRILIVALPFLVLVGMKAAVFPFWAASLTVVFVLGIIMLSWYFKKLEVGRLKAILAGILLLVGFLDMCFYQHQLLKNSPRMPQDQRANLNSVNVNDYTYDKQRVFDDDEDPADRSWQAMSLLLHSAGHKNQFEYGFVQKDFCLSKFIVATTASDLLRLGKINPVLPIVFAGCYDVKLRLYNAGEYAHSMEENERFLKKVDGVLKGIVGNDAQKMPLAVVQVSQLLKDTVLLQVGEDAFPELGKQQLSSDDIGHIKVVTYNTDDMTIDVDVKHPSGGWLYYADAFHPDWHCLVDGKQTKIILANGAFKAVYLSEGKHRVRFYFDQGLIATAGLLLAIFGLLMGALLCWYIFITGYRESK